MTIQGKPAVYEYLNWLYEHQQIIYSMKELNKNLLEFESSIDSSKHKEVISKFRRNLIRLQKEYAKADMELNEIQKL